MGRGVLPEFAIIVRLRQNPAVLNDQGGDRYFAEGRRPGRFFQGHPHEREILCALVSWHCSLLNSGAEILAWKFSEKEVAHERDAEKVCQQKWIVISLIGLSRLYG